MTRELKCPVCGHKLALETEHEDKLIETMYCPMCKHFMLGNYRIWQALTQAKQDLEIARKALKDITKEHSAFADWVFKAVTMKNIAEKALKQIEHKE